MSRFVAIILFSLSLSFLATTAEATLCSNPTGAGAVFFNNCMNVHNDCDFCYNKAQHQCLDWAEQCGWENNEVLDCLWGVHDTHYSDPRCVSSD